MADFRSILSDLNSIVLLTNRVRESVTARIQEHEQVQEHVAARIQDNEHVQESAATQPQAKQQAHEVGTSYDNPIEIDLGEEVASEHALNNHATGRVDAPRESESHSVVDDVDMIDARMSRVERGRPTPPPSLVRSLFISSPTSVVQESVVPAPHSSDLNGRTRLNATRVCSPDQETDEPVALSIAQTKPGYFTGTIVQNGLYHVLYEPCAGTAGNFRRLEDMASHVQKNFIDHVDEKLVELKERYRTWSRISRNLTEYASRSTCMTMTVFKSMSNCLSASTSEACSTYIRTHKACLRLMDVTGYETPVVVWLPLPPALRPRKAPTSLFYFVRPRN